MKSKHLFISLFLLLATPLFSQVGINKDGTQPNADAILHVKGDATNNNIILEPGNNGAVGIGEAAPEGLLHLYKTGDAWLDIRTNSFNKAGLRLRENAVDKFGFNIYYDGGPGLGALVFEGIGNNGISYGKHMIIKRSDGNVGIGTTNPASDALLHIKGDDAQNNIVFELGDNGGFGINTIDPNSALHIKMSGTTHLDGFRLETSQATAEDWYYYMSTSDDLTFRNDANDLFTITKDVGNVGIGVTDPDTKLEVNGQIKITGGNPGENKVLTSNADGLARWEKVTDNLGNNYGTVVNSITGKTWLDRNLGASRVAQAFDDSQAYGGLYQWGRAQDGHEDRNSLLSNTQADTWIADLGINAWDEKFIKGSSKWLNPQNDNLWSRVSAENNPCPSGYRIPTNAEWVQEIRTWTSQDGAGAFGSPLKLTAGGYRNHLDGLIRNTGAYYNYWSATIDADKARFVEINNVGTEIKTIARGYGFSVRCIKN